MALPALRRMTAEAFDLFADLPENAERLLEFIAGEVFEVPSNPSASKIGMLFVGHFFVFLQKNPIAEVTGEAGGYMVNGERYAPDVAVVLKARGVLLATRGYHPRPPDLAVEVCFPTTIEGERQLRIKVANYLAAGTLVWVVYPDARQVEVYAPGKPPLILGVGGTLDGGEVLPGFALAVSAVFPAEG